MNKAPKTTVEEPETEAPEVITQEFDFKPIDNHEWRQQGTDAVCSSCPVPHGSIGVFEVGQVLSKNEKGEYVVTKEY